MEKFYFPKDFVWGTATAAHQIEGNNINSDWWKWENRDKSKDSKSMFCEKSKWPKEPSNLACDSYNRYEEDLDLCTQLNNNAVRLSVEWARIQPKENEFDQNEIEHYKNVLKAAKKRNLQTFVTLHHFTNPVWFSEKGGWTNINSPKYFAQYAQKCAEMLADLTDVFLTINEPQVYATMSYLVGKWPPQETNPFLSFVVQLNFIRAHNAAYDAIKKIGDYKVGIVKHIAWYEADPDFKNIIGVISAKIMYFFNADIFLKPIMKHLDVIGVNYYFTGYVKYFRSKGKNEPVSDLGWWLETKGIKKILMDIKKYNKPTYITENGLADANDTKRTEYIKGILTSCAEAIQLGAPLKGYFHWSLLDNYEWAEGFWPRFGLTEIDYANSQKRIPRKSFYAYANICKNGTIE